MLAHAYLDHACAIVQEYRLQQPLALYLKAYFKGQRQCGSRDRRRIADLVYGHYRMGPQPVPAQALPTLAPVKQHMVLGAWLQGGWPQPFFEATRPDLCSDAALPQNLRWRMAEEVFGWKPPQAFPMSPEAQGISFVERLYRQPSVFIRLRRPVALIEPKLRSGGISFETISDQCIRVAANTKLDAVLAAEEYRVQDSASQQVGSFLRPKPGETWWDCCAASGGKTLLLLDSEKNIKLTVSDVRSGILRNLQLRVGQYHPDKKYRVFCCDLSDPVGEVPGAPFDHILCDAPCSGSGTWARSPEQAWFFGAEDLEAFHRRQCLIGLNAAQHLKPGGRLIYITCSLFERENEAVVQRLSEQGLALEEQHVLDAHASGGDTLFLAILRKPNS